MHFEFSSLLTDALRQLEPDSDTGVTSSDIPSRLHWHDLSIADCPRGIEGFVTSSVAFHMAGRSAERRRARGLEPISSTKIGERLAADVSKSVFHGMPRFHIEIGGEGHLNATPSLPFVAAFVAQAFEEDRSWFFAESGVSQMLGEEVCFGERCDCLRPLRVPTSQELYCELQESSGLDAKEWEVFLQSKRVPPEKEVQLMLLAGKADAELRFFSYLKGLSGRENVPWYVDRFFSDVERFQVILEKRGASVTSMPWYEVLRLLNAEKPSAMRLLPRIRLLMVFRHRYLLSRFLQRPEILLEHLLLVMKDFYLYFNHPRIRQALVNDFEPEELLCLGLLNKTLSCLCREGLACISPK